jgi:two-component system, sensor histidine kinase PdtaS
MLGPIYPRNRPYIEGALRGEAQSFEREIPDPRGGPPRSSQAHYLPHIVDGTVLGFVVMVTDITSRIRLETSLAATVREREVLLQEVHHRVKNNLQVISSLMSMQIRQLDDATSIAALRDCQSRVDAISLIHQQLYQASDYARVPFSEYARGVAAASFHAQHASPELELRLDVADVRLPIDKAIPCGLILNELITNALKHAFVDGRRGTLEVTLAAEPAAIVLSVADDGVGMPTTIAPARTLGLQLIDQLTQQLDGTLELAVDRGTTFRVRFPYAG